jgi:uncharacterized membrane protein
MMGSITPTDLLISASWLGPVIFCYISCVSVIPFIAVRKILGHVVGAVGFNDIRYFDRVDHNSRQVVIPSPDFLYSSVALDLPGHSDVVHVKAPFSVEYASLGVYDDNGRCIHIVSHPNKEMDVLILGSNVVLADTDILTAVPTELKSCSIIRLQSSRSLLLHRLFVPDPSLQHKYRDLQHSIKCTFMKLPIGDLPMSSQASSNASRRMPTAPVVAVAVAAIEFLAFRRGLLTWGRALKILLVSVVLGLIAAFATLKFLKNPKCAGFVNLTKHHHLSDWKFHLISSKPKEGITSWISQPFHHLVTFLHGALALLPSEVLYGTAFCDADDDLLRYGGAYLIQSPSLSLGSLWWSITLYGDDLFLIENAENIYSVNSFQLRPYADDIASNGFIRVLCSPVRPDDATLEKHRIRYWIPLPERSSSSIYAVDKSPLNKSKDSSKAPRLILRGDRVCTSSLLCILEIFNNVYYLFSQYIGLKEAQRGFIARTRVYYRRLSSSSRVPVREWLI